MTKKRSFNVKTLTSSKVQNVYPEEVLQSYARVNNLEKDEAVRAVNLARKAKGLKEAYPENSFCIAPLREEGKPAPKKLESNTKFIVPTEGESRFINFMLNSKSRDYPAIRDRMGISDGMMSKNVRELKEKGYGVIADNENVFRAEEREAARIKSEKEAAEKRSRSAKRAAK